MKISQQSENASKQLKQLLSDLDLNQMELAVKVDVSRPTIAKWLDDPLVMTYYQGFKLASALNIPYDVMLKLMSGETVKLDVKKTVNVRKR